MSRRPSDQEEEYFARLEFERRKKTLADEESRSADEERRRVLAAIRNRCPKCGAALVPVPYGGVELDKCSECEGVWLDCGELERVAPESEGNFLRGLRRIFG